MKEGSRKIYILLLGIIAMLVSGYLWGKIPDRCTANYIIDTEARAYRYSVWFSYVGSFCFIISFLISVYDMITAEGGQIEIERVA